VVDLASRHWVANVVFAWQVVANKLGASLFFAAVVWMASIALEPFARRVWPNLLIGWTRLVGVLSVVLLRRYGLLAFSVAITAWTAVNITPWTFELTKWFAWRQGMTVVFLLALALWGFRNVLGKQSVFPAAALEG
jgi:hypothetical protein